MIDSENGVSRKVLNGDLSSFDKADLEYICETKGVDHALRFTGFDEDGLRLFFLRIPGAPEGHDLDSWSDWMYGQHMMAAFGFGRPRLKSLEFDGREIQSRRYGSTLIYRIQTKSHEESYPYVWPVVIDLKGATSLMVARSIEGGMSRKDVMVKYNISKYAVGNYARRHGVPPNKIIRRSKIKPVVARMARQGCSVNYIMKRLGVGKTMVYDVMSESGIEPAARRAKRELVAMHVDLVDRGELTVMEASRKLGYKGRSFGDCCRNAGVLMRLGGYGRKDEFVSKVEDGYSRLSLSHHFGLTLRTVDRFTSRM